MKTTLKRALCGIFVLAFMLANANIALAADAVEVKPKFASPTLYASNEAAESTSSLPIDVDEFQSYLLEQLKVLPADEERVVEIDISKYNIPYTDENYQALLNLIWYESPELFRAQSLGVGGYDTFKTLYVECVADFCDPRYFAECSDLMESIVDDFVSDLKNNNNLSDVEKALILHDRLATYCEYDYDNYRNNTLPRVSYTAYGILGLGTGVCMGYALAYDYLLEQVGIKSDYCSSKELNHAWNIVYINSVPYHVDVTWDDPTRDVSGRVYHDNFLRSTNGIMATGHDASDFITTPIDTTYDNYFWQDSATAFQMIDNTIYYVDNRLRDETQGVKTGKLIALDGINDATPEVLKELSFTWYHDKTSGSYWPDNYTRLGSIRDLLYYSTPESVCSYNPVTKETKELITSEDIIENYGDANLSIFGLTTHKCFYWGEYSNTPGYSATTKEKYFSGFNHNPTENWKEEIAPTYSSQGKETNYCIDCGAELGSRLTPALSEHNFGDWYIDPNNKPTCTEKGVKKRDCQDAGCDVFEWDYADELGHDYSNTWTVDLEPTCSSDGEESRHCTRCGDRVDIQSIDATGIHVEGDAWIKGKAASCKEDGYLYKACKGCGKEMSTQILPKGDCANFSTSNYKAPSCTEDGYTGDKTCLDCGKVYKGEVVKAKGHTKSVSNIKTSTCTENGYTGDTYCSVCKVLIEKGVVINAKGHTTIIINAKEPTATEVGYTGDTYCSVCKTVVAKGEEILKFLELSTPTVQFKNTAKGILVSWNAVENAKNYIIYRSVYNASTKKWSKWASIKSGVTDVNYTDTTTKLGTSYKYTVRAVNGDVKSKYNDTKGLKYDVTPTVKVAVASNGVKVSWSTAANATGYTVYRSQYNTSTKKWSGWKNMGTAKADKTSWTDKSVKSGVQYKYTVRAANGKVLSSYNKSGAATMFLAQPTVKIANNAKGVKVAWSKVSGATGYRVYRSEYTNGAWTSWKSMGTAKAANSSWVDKSVVSGVQYKYTVRAVNGKVLSTYKSTSALIYLAQPTVKIANASTGIKVNWSTSAGATGYTVYRSEYNTKTKKWSNWKSRGTAAANKTSWTDKKVTSGVKYKYTVRAISAVSKSTYVSSPELLYLAQPIVSVEKNSNGVKVTWNKVSSATGYRIYRKANNETNWKTLATVKSTSYTDKSVSTDSTYTYTVRAYKDKTWSSYDSKGVTISLNYKKAVLDLVNAERVKAGLEPLEYYSEGQKAGDIRALEIKESFSHTRPDGTLCFTALKEQGIEYRVAGENIAIGFYTPETAMDAWMNSKGHRENILTPEFTHLIVGYDEESKAWVQLFLG